jgi:hypothetical protein
MYDIFMGTVVSHLLTTVIESLRRVMIQPRRHKLDQATTMRMPYEKD